MNKKGKILCRAFGGKKTNIGWERRTNSEIYKLYNTSKISAVVRARRLQWLGDLERMEESRTVKGIAWKTPADKKKQTHVTERSGEEL